ncbi:hypothetical protein ACP70R_032558 [Stipagrostis hirtigluma subsp. patula]
MATPRMITSAGSNHLPIQVISRRLIKASDTSMVPQMFPFSNLDLIHSTTQTSVTCVYAKPPVGDFSGVVAAFEAELPAFLNYYFPIAGRLVTNPTTGLPELHCLNQGTELVVANAGVKLGSPDWSISARSLKMINLPYADDLPLSVQLVSFTCGGFVVVWATNSLVADCQAMATLVRMWSEFVRVGLITGGAGPNPDRSVFRRPRHPPSYSASLDEEFTPRAHEHEVNALTAEDSFVERLYYVEARDVAGLRDMASANGGGHRATRVEALSAYLWKALAGVVDASARLSDGDKRCRMGWWVDARQRLAAPEFRSALRSYLGNATTYAVAEAAVDTVLESTLPDVAAMVREAIVSVDYDERCRQLVDWVAERKLAGGVAETATVGRGSPTLSQMVWATFPGDTDFGFGEAALAMPVSANGRLCSAYLCVASRPGDDRPWIVSAYVWPSFAAALESDERRIFKPLTAQHLGFTRDKHVVVPDATPRL